MRSQDQSPDTTRAAAPGPRIRLDTRTGPLPLNHAVGTRSPEAVLALQRAAGNTAVAALAERERHTHDAGCGHAPVQRSAVNQVIASPGSPLPTPVRQDMESRLGADFTDVRLHTDATARRSAAEVGARAYTSGSHIVIGDGGADPHTLAHELTHVIQQRQGPVAGTDNGSGLRISDPSDRFEREAEANAHRVMSAPAPVTAPVTAPAVQRSATNATATPAPHHAVVQRMNGTATAGPDELALMANPTVRDMGGGFRKYTVDTANPGGDPEPLYRGMRGQEFAALRAGALPQGGSYQGFSPTRAYSEGYITNSPNSGTHLVEFYRTDPASGVVPALDTFLKNAGAGTKAENGILSTAVGMTAAYSPTVHSNTTKNEARETTLATLRQELAQAEQDVTNPAKARFKKQAEKRVQTKKGDIAKLEAKAPLYPAKGDAVKALNAAFANGTVAWRLITFKSTA
ncbi:DUF4157 domain-containing protein [Streptomyces bobili]|uniref:eCIS core domain-containing protein n=1 Tax=Streptomyces bobili TaxID=67280 RepID=UPI0036E27746